MRAKRNLATCLVTCPNAVIRDPALRYEKKRSGLAVSRLGEWLARRWKGEAFRVEMLRKWGSIQEGAAARRGSCGLDLDVGW